jgi:hypothetical protein
VQLYGPGKERDRKIEWYENDAVCPDCYREQKQQEKSEQIAKANEQASTYLATRPDLPPLTGSEKQISWANTIRAGILADAEKYQEGIAKSQHTGEGIEIVRRLYPVFYSELCAQKSAKWWIDNRQMSQNEAIHTGNPMAMIGAVMTGETPKHTALTLWDAWLAKNPEAIAYREKLQKEYEQKKAEYEAKKEAHIKDVLSCLERVDWEKAIADDEEIISTDGHKIDVVQANMAWIQIDKIDGKSEIEFDGKFACWVGQRPEVRELNKKLTAIWEASCVNPLKNFIVGDRPESITKQGNDPDYPALTVKSKDGRTATIVMWDDWDISEVSGKIISDGARKSNHARRIISEVKSQMEATK